MKQKINNIVLFGGSFDPPHIGHKKIVDEILKTITLDKFIITPTYLSPFKTKHKLKASDRFRLLKNIFYTYKNVEISDYEIQQNKKSYSIETIKYFKQLYNTQTIYLVLGTDNLKDLPHWYCFDELKKIVKFIVIKRDGSDFNISYNIDMIKIDSINLDISSSSLRDNLEIDYIPQNIQKDLENIWNKE